MRVVLPLDYNITMPPTRPSLIDQLERTLVVAVVPALAAGLAACNATQSLEAVELAARLLAIRLLAQRCAAGRGLPDGQLATAERDLCYQAGATLDGLDLNWGTLPARTLGACYEALLGQRLTTNEGRFLLVGDRVGRKATGSFYTPQPIAERIVAATLGPLLTAHEQRLRGGSIPWTRLLDFSILDPALGSGHFLLAAVDYVTNWLATMRQHGPPELLPDTTICLRQQVLEHCIYGVDSDPGAVEVARLCLWLHCAAPNSSPSVWEGNLRCGNSLVGQGFASSDWEPPDEELPTFDWAANFPAVARRGGFAAVVGNPPYVTNFSPAERRAVLGWTRTRGRELDACYLFVERSAHLLRAGGRFGMIIPNVFMRQHDSASFRRFLLDQTVESIVDYGFDAFGTATVPTAAVVFQKAPAPAGHLIQLHSTDGVTQAIPQATFAALPNAQINPRLTAALPTLRAIELICDPLEALASSHEGIHSGNIRHKLFTKEIGGQRTRPLLKGSDIARYRLHWGGWRVHYDPALIDRRAGEYASLRDERLFTQPKIWTRQTGDRIIATWDGEGFYADNTLHGTQLRPSCQLSPFYVLALLNSRLLSVIYQALTGERGRALAQVKLVFLRRLPIRRIIFSTPPDERRRFLAEIEPLIRAGHGAEHQVLAHVASWLEQGQEDIVHDLLALLAERMLALTGQRDVGAPLVDQLIDSIVERLYGEQEL